MLVPVKAFGAAKGRLAPVLDAGARARLAEQMATRVLKAAAPLPATVVCDDEGVAAWARACGASVVWSPGRGLNRAVADGVAWLASQGAARVIVAHADLPLAEGLTDLAGGDGVTLVPDRRDDGTNVAVVPVWAGFRFSYGVGSFGRHVGEAARLGLTVSVVRRPDLAWDVDLPADLAYPEPVPLPTPVAGRP